VIESNRWEKWLSKEEKGIDFILLQDDRKDWLISTGCRYIWQKPEVVVSRRMLYDNLVSNGFEAEEIVLSRIQHDMDKYFKSFNLNDLNKFL
jgi:hypothetical protein